MTPLTVTESEIAAKRPPARVTRRASLSATEREVLSRSRRTHLPRLRCARRHFVAVSACEPLSRAVVGVTESETIGARVGARWTVAFLIVADTARRDLAARV